MQYEEEEGEIIDDDQDSGLEVYKPLERPEVWSGGGRGRAGCGAVSSEEEEDDGGAMPPRPARPPDPLGRYNVWQIDLSEELTTSLNFSTLAFNGANDRHIESYHYLPSAAFNLHHKKQSKAELRNYRGTHVKRLAPLAVTEHNSVEEITKDICKKLKEKNQGLIHNAVSVIGKKKAILLYRKTRNIEKNGGILVKSRMRQRTSGGVFLYLLHTDKDLSEGQLKEIFQDDGAAHQTKLNRQKRNKKRKSKDKIPKIASVDDEDGELKSGGELEAIDRVVRTPPPSPVAPSTSPPVSRLCTTSLLDQTSALLARTNDMQVE